MQGRWTALAALTLAHATTGVQFRSVAARAPLVTKRHDLGGAALGALIGLYLLPASPWRSPAAGWASASASCDWWRWDGRSWPWAVSWAP